MLFSLMCVIGLIPSIILFSTVTSMSEGEKRNEANYRLKIKEQNIFHHLHIERFLWKA